MTADNKTKMFNYGHKDESTWPPLFGDRYNPDTGEILEDPELAERRKRINKPRDADAPMVITDEIEPTLSMTGSDKIYTSKRKLREEYKEMGFIETGGEKPKPRVRDLEAEKKARRDDVERTLYDLKYDRVPVSEESREINRREEREYNEYARRQRS